MKREFTIRCQESHILIIHRVNHKGRKKIDRIIKQIDIKMIQKKERMAKVEYKGHHHKKPQKVFGPVFFNGRIQKDNRPKACYINRR